MLALTTYNKSLTLYYESKQMMIFSESEPFTEEQACDVSLRMIMQCFGDGSSGLYEVKWVSTCIWNIHFNQTCLFNISCVH